MKIHTGTRIRESGSDWPTLTCGQIRGLLAEAEGIYGPDSQSWAGPRYGATLGLATWGTVAEVRAAIEEQISGWRDETPAPWHLAQIVCGERHRRRCRLAYDARAAVRVRRRA